MLPRTLSTAALALGGALAAAAPAAAQNITGLPQPSPHAVVEQRFGMTDVKIEYHRPSARDRELWGRLVPYGEVWRAGANDNTTITFSTPVKVEGKDLAAGTYGLHMIPTESTWTIAFSHNNTSWGSFSYREDEDALRVTVTPEKAPFQETLEYSFEDVTNGSTMAVLHWGELKVPFEVAADVRALALAHIRNELRHLPGFAWQGWNSAAAYCLNNDFNHEEALGWADRSIAMNRNAVNQMTKAGLLGRLNRMEEADALIAEALDGADENQTNTIGYMFLQRGMTDRAIDVFRKNTVAYPESWNVWDSLGEGLAAKGDTQGAVENYTKALGMVEDENQKSRIRGILANLNGG
jgi:tetratricopeptide (TPR) repeat protein